MFMARLKRRKGALWSRTDLTLYGLALVFARQGFQKGYQ